MAQPNGHLPPVLTLHVANKSPCGFDIGRSVSSISGKPAGLRIVAVDPSLGLTDTAPRIGDRILSINGLDPKNSPDIAKNIISEANGDKIELQVLRSSASEYRLALISTRFGREYNVELRSSTQAVLKPKNNPSLLVATLFPMFRTRYKYLLHFDDATGEVSFEDMYALTFNRANGATPEQQGRIQQRHREFKEALEKMEAQMEHDYEESRRVALKRNKQ